MLGRRTVALIADAVAAQALTALREAWNLAGWAERMIDAPQFTGGVPTSDELAVVAADADAVLLVGPRARSPRTVLPAPIAMSGERAVPVAWLPFTSVADLRIFAAAAARVHGRAPATERMLAVLGERQPRFDRLADRVVRLAREDDTGMLAADRWTAYELTREDLAHRLGGGPALAVYVGHGRPIGWVGYAGLRAHHLASPEPAAPEPASPEPTGAIVSLTCKTASRRRTGLSFAEALPLRGISAAALGAVGPTLHTVNARWAVRLAKAAPTAATVGDLVARMCASDPAATHYRLLGDPTAPLRSAALRDAPLRDSDRSSAAEGRLRMQEAS